MEWYEPALCLLKQETFPGECKFANKDKCKQLGARWRNGRWTALDKDTLLALCDSGLWWPKGMNQEANIMIVKLLRKEQTDREEADMKARMRKTGPTEEEKAAARLKEFGVPPDEPELLEDLASKGITEDMSIRSGDYSWLGPRSGISNASRLLRGLRFNLVTVEGVVSGKAEEPPYSLGKRGKAPAGGRREGKVGIKRVRTSSKQVHEEEREPQPPQAKSTNNSHRAEYEPVTNNGQWLGKQIRKAIDYVDTAVCDDCGVVVDRRQQFLECGCDVMKVWRCCVRCFRPVPSLTPSPMCEPCKNA